MNTMLKQAHALGAAQAEKDFEKQASGYETFGDYASPALGALSAFPGLGGPLLSGAMSGATAPKGQGWDTGVRTGLGSLGGAVAGGIGGAGVGAGLGYGGAQLIDAMGGDLSEEDIRKALIYGALLGGGVGAGGGGAYGAHLGRTAGKEQPQ
jgi:hypothetical protein